MNWQSTLPFTVNTRQNKRAKKTAVIYIFFLFPRKPVQPLRSNYHWSKTFFRKTIITKLTIIIVFITQRKLLIITIIITYLVIFSLSSSSHRAHRACRRLQSRAWLDHQRKALTLWQVNQSLSQHTHIRIKTAASRWFHSSAPSTKTTTLSPRSTLLAWCHANLPRPTSLLVNLLLLMPKQHKHRQRKWLQQHQQPQLQ